MKDKFLIIDFDSTFIQVEAADELAAITLKDSPDAETILNKFKQITNQGMDGSISLYDSLMSRIKLLDITQTNIDKLIVKLNSKISKSFTRNAKFIEQNAKNIYIVSSGFKEYILPIVTQFGIDPKHVLANTFKYDDKNNIIGFDETNPLCQNHGKVKVVEDLKLIGEILVIGDGYTDYEIRQANIATKFYAFTENVERTKVIAKADHVIKSFDEFLYLNHLPMATSYPKSKIKILLLENVHSQAIELLKQDGFDVESYKGGLNEDELCEKIKGVSVLGIRSKTEVTKKVLDNADHLLAIGAFCIGTNQIDCKSASKKGISVFNAPYSNTRSVVELVIGEIIILLRNVITKNAALHQGKWDKSANNSFEVRGKKLGIIGYGNIGAQLSVLAEALGMQVFYYDIIEKLQLGNAKKCNTLKELLEISDIITIHVDGRDDNKHFIDHAEFNLMKDKVIFLNLSRGHIVNLDALVDNLKSGKILGAAIDVFPYEPKDNKEEFINELRQFENVILTPHIGGSTEEAQLNIGDFVAHRMMNYINSGDSTQSINLPNIQLPELKNAHRIIHLHENVPGILAQINQVLANHKINLTGQYLKTNEQVGYVISDIEAQNIDEKTILTELRQIEYTIKTRILY